MCKSFATYIYNYTTLKKFVNNYFINFWKNFSFLYIFLFFYLILIIYAYAHMPDGKHQKLKHPTETFFAQIPDGKLELTYSPDGGRRKVYRCCFGFGATFRRVDGKTKEKPFRRAL